MIGMMDIGRKFEGLDGSPVLKGWIRECFQAAR